MALTKEQILAIKDIEVTEIEVPVWENTVFIKQLTRGQQDDYLRRQYGEVNMRQEVARKKVTSQQDISGVNIFGHDAFLCACGICDKDGIPLFSLDEIKELEKKNGEAIGYIAKQIIDFSGMGEDVEALDELKN